MLAIYQTEAGATAAPLPEDIWKRRTVAQGDVIVTSDGDSFEVYTRRWFRAKEE